jgi:predicted DCC family thiol-disulfide oxidoreductase YuxK
LILNHDISERPLSDHAPKGGPTIYFDGSCPLCSAEIDHYASRDGGDKLGFVDVSASGVELGSDLSSSEAMRRFHVRRADGTLLSGARAFIAVWEALPGWQWPARIAKVPSVTAVIEISYRTFLKIRPMTSKLVRRFSRMRAK